MQTVTVEESRLELVSAVIHLAVVDCFSPYKPTREDARDFIFSNRISKFIRRFHVDEFLNVDYIRRQVKLGRDACGLRLTQGNPAAIDSANKNQGSKVFTEGGIK